MIPRVDSSARPEAMNMQDGILRDMEPEAVVL